MKKGQYNMVAKEGAAPYILTAFIATKLDRAKVETIIENNPRIFPGVWHFIPYDKTDFSMWARCRRHLTSTRIREAYFEIDCKGYIYQY